MLLVDPLQNQTRSRINNVLKEGGEYVKVGNELPEACKLSVITSWYLKSRTARWYPPIRGRTAPQEGKVKHRNGSWRIVSSRDVLTAANTHSADFQKCPGWESRRFSFGSFSSISMRTVKLGLSPGSKDQHAERISCKGYLWLMIPIQVKASSAEQAADSTDWLQPSHRYCLIEVLSILIIQQYPGGCPLLCGSQRQTLVPNLVSILIYISPAFSL